MTLFELLASGTAGSAVTGLLAYFTRKQELGKLNAEIQKIKADAEVVAAQADDLVSARLIRELDRLSAMNDLLGKEIFQLRKQVVEYAEREERHLRENRMLRAELEKIREETKNSPVAAAIRLAFPVADVIEPQVPETE